MELVIYNRDGEATENKAVLSDEVFCIAPNEHAIYLDVKQLLANRRQGTHRAKPRGEVRYSTRKLKKQKGTGGARAGSIKSPVFVGGGRIFGPLPRDYSHKLNKKQKLLARRSALSQKMLAGSIRVVEDFAFDAPKTKEFVQFWNNQKLQGRRLLFVLPEGSENIYLSVRNLQNVKTILANELNTYDIMHASDLVLQSSAVNIINEWLGSGAEEE